MEFKIDTKPTYTIIKPLSNHIDANLTDAIRQKWDELSVGGSQNLIIDLGECNNLDESELEAIVKIHEDFYSKDQSLVFTNVQADVMNALKKNETDLLINVAPRMDEAIDIVSMEILERDLFNEES